MQKSHELFFSWCRMAYPPSPAPRCSCVPYTCPAGIRFGTCRLVGETIYFRSGSTANDPIPAQARITSADSPPRPPRCRRRQPCRTNCFRSRSRCRNHSQSHFRCRFRFRFRFHFHSRFHSRFHSLIRTRTNFPTLSLPAQHPRAPLPPPPAAMASRRPQQPVPPVPPPPAACRWMTSPRPSPNRWKSLSPSPTNRTRTPTWRLRRRLRWWWWWRESLRWVLPE